MNKKEISIIKKLYTNKYTLIKKLKKEKELSINLYIKNDIFSAKKLITINIHKIINLAKKYTKYNSNLNDITQEGIIGLIKAIKRFNPQKGIKLLSFAVHWIKSEIHEYIIKNSKLIKLTNKLMEKIIKKNKINTNNLKNKQISEISIDENIYNEEVQQKTNEDKQIIDKKILLKLKTEIQNLNNRYKNIIKKRWLSKKKSTLKELSKFYSISIERIRQLENNSLKILKKKMNMI